MKTIFITSFEGVETKNVLRTSIFRTLLDDPEIRVVIFTRDPEHVRYHRQELGENPRIIYETVPKAGRAG